MSRGVVTKSLNDAILSAFFGQLNFEHWKSYNLEDLRLLILNLKLIINFRQYIYYVTYVSVYKELEISI